MDQLQGGLPGEAGEAAREALREAERNMGEAERGLREGDTCRARSTGSPTRSTACARACGRWARTCAGPRPAAKAAGRAEGQALSDGRNDPLGRPLGAQGNIGTNEQMLPEADAAARARGLLDEIRAPLRRPGRPQLELDYLRRLLDHSDQTAR